MRLVLLALDVPRLSWWGIQVPSSSDRHWSSSGVAHMEKVPTSGWRTLLKVEVKLLVYCSIFPSAVTQGDASVSSQRSWMRGCPETRHGWMQARCCDSAECL